MTSAGGLISAAASLKSVQLLCPNMRHGMRGGHILVLFEDFSKIALIREADVICDLRQGFGGISQQLRRPCDTNLIYKILQAHPCFLSEQSGEICRANAYGFRYLIQADFFTIMLPHIVPALIHIG